MRITACLLLPILAATACRDEPPTRFYRGNTHTHTLWSDGDGAPELVADWYREAGYDFLVLSDHNILSRGDKWFPIGAGTRLTMSRVDDLRRRFGDDAVEIRESDAASDGRMEMRLQTLDDLRERFERQGEFVFIEGEEVTASYHPRDGTRSLPIHVNGINLGQLVEPTDDGESAADVMNRNVDAVVAEGKRSGRPVLAHINHPNFGWALTWRDIAAVTNDRFFEVYNGHRGVNNLGDETRDSTEVMWDRALTLRLTELDLGLLYGLATDDAHSYHARDEVSIPGRGWVMVRSTSLTADAIVSAMRAGDFYASTGVTVRDFRADDEGLTVELAARQGEALTTRFIGTRHESDGAAGPVGQVLAETTNDPAVYRFVGDELYVRAVITSSLAHPDPASAGDPQRAWIQPVHPPSG